jgi:hypothetical protein
MKFSSLVELIQFRREGQRAWLGMAGYGNDQPAVLVEDEQRPKNKKITNNRSRLERSTLYILYQVH